MWHADSQCLREAAVQKYGSKILTSVSIKLEHTAKEFEPGNTVSHKGFLSAAGEWWAFGMCDFHLISMNSGFGRTAALRGASIRKKASATAQQHDDMTTIYTIAHPPNPNQPKKCGAADADSIHQIAFHWSGI